MKILVIGIKPNVQPIVNFLSAASPKEWGKPEIIQIEEENISNVLRSVSFNLILYDPDSVRAEYQIEGKDRFQLIDRIQQVITQIRQVSDLPLFIFSANTRASDVVKALNLGADNYTRKPIDPNLLLAQMQAVLRRSRGLPNRTFIYGELSINFNEGIVKINGELLRLSPTEFSLLAALAENVDRWSTHKYLLGKVWALADSPANRTYVKCYIHYLRRKLGTCSSGTMIETERRTGYMLTKT